MALKRSASHRLALILPSLIWLCHPHATFSIPKGIQDAAQDKSVDPGQYLRTVKEAIWRYRRSDRIAGRADFVRSLKEAMQEPGLRLVIGGKSLGKTKIVSSTITRERNYFGLLNVNMRLPSVAGSTSVLECLQEQARRTWNTKNLPDWFQRGLNAFQVFVETAGKGEARSDGVAGGAEVALARLLDLPKPEEFLLAWVEGVVAGGKVPAIIVDEANIAFPTNGENGSENAAKKEAASKALATFVALTKETGKASVILIASDYAFPLGLEQLGFNKYDSLKTIVVPEVEKEPMLQLLVEWGLSQDLAEEFYQNFGGNIFLCHQAIDKLLEQFNMALEELFEPLDVRGNAGLGDLVGGSLTRQHMVNLADKGWSPIQDGSPEEETESQKAARIIAKKNFGAIVDRATTTFLDPALQTEMRMDQNVKRFLIPPTTYDRKCIQSMVKTMKPSRPSQAGAVWVRQLQQDGNAFNEIGAAFQVKGDLKNVDDLKEAIKTKKPNRVSCDADEIVVYRKNEDTEWVEEKKMSASLRETEETDCYGFTLPSA